MFLQAVNIFYLTFGLTYLSYTFHTKLPISIPRVNPHTNPRYSSILILYIILLIYVSLYSHFYFLIHFNLFSVIYHQSLKSHHTVGWTSLIGINLIWLYAHISKMFIVTILSGEHFWPVFKTTVFITQLSILRHSTSFSRQ